MSVISAGNTTTTAVRVIADTTGNLVFTTGGANTTALTLSNTQAATFAGSVVVNSIASTGNVLFSTGASNVLALTIDQYQQSDFNGGIREKITVSAANATANVNFDVIDQGILYYTANASANSTINIRGNATVSLNTLMAAGETLSAVFMNTNGATARWVNGYQVDGAAVTPRWQGGSAPTGGNANAIDVYVFTVIKTANAAFTVLGSQTQFK